MNTQNMPEFGAIFYGVCEMYSKVPSPELVDLYFNALSVYEISEVRKAFSLHMLNPDGGQFMPKPADLVRLIDGNGISRAGQAWAKVLRTIGSCGMYTSVCFDDPLIHAVVSDLGGWVKLCETSLDELPFVQNRFEKLYQGYGLRTEQVAYPTHLIGVCEAENSMRGFRIEPPVPVGDLTKCRLVYQGGADGSTIRIGSAAEMTANLLARVSGPREEKAA